MVYAAEYSRSIEFGDTWMNSRISASGQTAFAELTTGVESGMSISARAIHKNFDGAEMWQTFGASKDHTTECYREVNRPDEVYLYAEGTFRANGSNGVYKTDFVNCSNY